MQNDNNNEKKRIPEDSFLEPETETEFDWAFEDMMHASWVAGLQRAKPAVAGDRTSLRQALKNLEQTGLQLDAHRLRENICSQFPNYRLWIRELIANAFDAQAKSCRIWGSEDSQTRTIHVADDGHGMDRQGVETFLRKFSSRKQKPESAVGRFGIGSFSVAAIPCQLRFTLITSTGQETWRLSTGILLESRPIDIERVTPVQPKGTTVSVTFSKATRSLVYELRQLCQLARKYLHHLPIKICFAFPDNDNTPEPDGSAWVPGNWIQDPGERFSKRFCCELNSYVFDVVLGVAGRARQQLYQQRVLITEDKPDHDLLSQDLSGRRLTIAHLSIRVDSPQFEMPLGRHCLSDPAVLKVLAGHLREQILPQYLRELVQLYECSSTEEFLIHPSEVEDMLATWMATHPESAPADFSRVSFFQAQDGRRVSFADLIDAVKRYQVIYLEDPSAAGLDYEAFEAPVLSAKQPEKGLEFLRGYFGEKLVDLGVAGLVLEAPAQASRPLSATEQRFGKTLGFSPELLSAYRTSASPDRLKNSAAGRPDTRLPQLPEKVAAQLRSEMQAGCADLQQIKWEVGHLVQQDGRTPCRKARFLSKGQRLILNLYHPEIVKLVALSEQSPNLAGHFATALCLSRDDRNTILAHIPAERREKLIYLDAIFRCGHRRSPGESRIARDQPDANSSNLSLKDFLRRASEENSGFGTKNDL